MTLSLFDISQATKDDQIDLLPRGVLQYIRGRCETISGSYSLSWPAGTRTKAIYTIFVVDNNLIITSPYRILPSNVPESSLASTTVLMSEFEKYIYDTVYDLVMPILSPVYGSPQEISSSNQATVKFAQYNACDDFPEFD